MSKSLRYLQIHKQTILSTIDNGSLWNAQSSRQFHLSGFNSVSKGFEDAKNNMSKLKEEPDNDVKLKIYALFKQATVGACNTPKPSMVDFVGRAKWSSWSSLGSLSQADAEKEYINIINGMLAAEGPADASTSTETSKYTEILASVECGNILKITLNRPAKFNAITIKMYNEISEALASADQDPNILMVCFTGAGEYYCSGNDLTNFYTKEAMEDIQKAAVTGGVTLDKFVSSFINFSKPLIAVINGPAVGISVTLLGLFDSVFASDKATFLAPFTKIAQSPEACSTYTFPRMMGHLRANEILLFNRKLNAQEALERNLVTEVIPHVKLEQKAWEKIAEFSKLPKESLLESRRVLRHFETENLKRAHARETEVLIKRWSSSEFMRVMMEFWKPKK